MTRLIRFRGRGIKDGRWYYGQLRTSGNKSFIRTAVADTFVDGDTEVQVDPKTVGQFTNLTDTAGVWVYEDDTFFVVVHAELDNENQRRAIHPGIEVTLAVTWDEKGAGFFAQVTKIDLSGVVYNNQLKSRLEINVGDISPIDDYFNDNSGIVISGCQHGDRLNDDDTDETIAGRGEIKLNAE
jgi:hypothetical protein